MTSDRLAIKLREYMADHRYSQSALARMLGIPGGTLRGFLSNGRSLSLQRKLEICDRLGWQHLAEELNPQEDAETQLRELRETLAYVRAQLAERETQINSQAVAILAAAQRVEDALQALHVGILTADALSAVIDIRMHAQDIESAAIQLKGHLSMTVEKGKTYRVNHLRKGRFTIKVTEIVGQGGDEWVTGQLVEGRTTTMLEENQRDTGESVTLRRSFCTFTEVEHE